MNFDFAVFISNSENVTDETKIHTIPTKSFLRLDHKSFAIIITPEVEAICAIMVIVNVCINAAINGSS